MSKTKKPVSKPTAAKDGSASSFPTAKGSLASQDFLVMAANMSWQLAIVVLIPIIGGRQLDKAANTSYVFTLIGLAVALIGSTIVMWRSMQVANRLPVPKLTAAQKRAVKKSYEEDDD